MRCNLINLYGPLAQNPQIMTVDASGQERATLLLTVIRGMRPVEDGSRQMTITYPIIKISDKEMIDEIRNAHENDIVEVKGVIVTKNITRVAYCPSPECKKEFHEPGELTYIKPIFLKVRKQGLDKNQAKDELMANQEISNQALVIGNLCSNPMKIVKPSNDKKIIAQYQVAVPRKYYIKDTNEEGKTDFPWVKSYGSVAKSDIKHLRQGSTVMLDGCLQAREGEITRTCPDCGQSFKYKTSILEIVPFATEYLANFVTDEDIALAKEEETTN